MSSDLDQIDWNKTTTNKPMKRYYDLTKEEKLALTDDAFYQSVKLEGISRNIKPPITVGAVLNQGGYPGFSLPPDSVVFYEIIAPGQYSGSDHRTGMAFKTADDARKACIGAVRIEESSYSKPPVKIITGDFSVREVYVSFSNPTQYRAQVEEFSQDDTEFDKLCSECRADLSTIHQEEYNRKVNSRKRAEYLSLAGGDESVAKAFWTKMEGTEFPAA